MATTRAHNIMGAIDKSVDKCSLNMCQSYFLLLDFLWRNHSPKCLITVNVQLSIKIPFFSSQNWNFFPFIFSLFFRIQYEPIILQQKLGNIAVGWWWCVMSYHFRPTVPPPYYVIDAFGMIVSSPCPAKKQKFAF